MLELFLRYLLHRFVGRALHRGADKALRSFTLNPVRDEAGWPSIRIDGRAITKRLSSFLNDLPHRAFAAAKDAGIDANRAVAIELLLTDNKLSAVPAQLLHSMPDSIRLSVLSLEHNCLQQLPVRSFE